MPQQIISQCESKMQKAIEFLRKDFTTIRTGKANPSGKLTDTIAYNIEDYPSHKNFGDRDRNIYQEDIYVGYRYFETFAKDSVMYPFGFGLSYSSFQIDFASAEKGDSIVPVLNCSVKNTGKVAGKEVLQLYVEAPQGKLGKPARAICAFEKSEIIENSKIDNKINIEGSYEKDGSFEALYVREAKGVVLTYLLSYVVPSYEKEKIENVTYENEDARMIIV